MSDRLLTYGGGEDIRRRTFEFACGVVRFCQQLYDSGGVARMMVPQLLACSTSTTGMLQEARAAESDWDFLSKCSIGLKEANESVVRLRICEACQLGPGSAAQPLRAEAEEIASIIATIIRNKKANMRAHGLDERPRRRQSPPAQR